jgi:Matrixin
MRPIFILILLAGVLLSVSVWYQDTAHMCPAPVHYRIGQLDARFGIDTEAAKQFAAKAEAEWESALSRELFVYDESADFAINFIYDERQQRARTEEEWRIALDADEVRNQAQIEEIKRLGAQYEVTQGEYEADRARYESQLASYNEEVATHNAAGGAPEEVYAKLQKEAKELEEALEAILKLERELKKEAEAITVLGEKANADIATYNAEVIEYNELFGYTDTYTQGDFERDRINVYKFSDEREIVTVLAHEFGHALGIGHVEGETSVMYYLLTQRDSTTLSATDKEAFIAVCGTEPTLAHELRLIIRQLLETFK